MGIHLGVLSHQIAEGIRVQQERYLLSPLVKHACVVHWQLACCNGLFQFVHRFPPEMRRSCITCRTAAGEPEYSCPPQGSTETLRGCPSG